ncbi:hypothetical protein C8P68_101139 [Mucilaginibacter yixingensis]|uniref:Uncharacterized protein n=1 Tax=Mucilaginibacter yixingensis TaxID=1295612 RepID=A0A2T5JEN9_9SPHI|nr:hypothetical protein [Mucilaginibacter yixingensis]PTR00910.1 hypothetical protein C8P68_101139 [Mucilaginibacter yixingensis]
MRKILTLLIVLTFSGMALAQSTSQTLNKLAVPQSPAFSITDITPGLAQVPGTPKAFALGVAQSVQQSGSLFPNNFSAQFAPVWWIAPNGLNVYDFLGINKNTHKDNPWGGIKYTMLSVAFINKDLIPDNATTTQKVYALGLHTNLFRIYRKHSRDTTRAQYLVKRLKDWHDAVQTEFDNDALLIAQLSRYQFKHPEDTAAASKMISKLGESRSTDIMKQINDAIAEKPLFNWDIAGAVAVYGVDDETVKTGRTAVWTQLSTYIPLGNISNGNYFTLSAMGRYLADNFEKNDKGVIGLVNNKDIGANAGFEFNRLSISVESLYRFASQLGGTENRTVGVLNVRVSDNLIVSGSFGKDFAGPNKLISVFGINLGLGKEKVTLP